MKTLLLPTALFSIVLSAHAETTPSVPATPAANPAAAAPVSTPKPVTNSTPANPAKPVINTAAVAKPAADATPVAAPVPTAEQRRQQELLANAERIDQVNRELLAHNQELELQNENLNLQNHVLQRDKSTDGIWKGAASVIIGFLMGWFFASSRKKSRW